MNAPLALPARSRRSRRGWLITGLILFIYIISHLLNHALGLFGFATMAAGQRLFIAVWQNPVGTVLLYGALLIHFLLAMRSLYDRRHFVLRPRDAVQLVLGLAIPPLLVGHAIDTRLAHELFGAIPTYERVSLMIWLRPEDGVIQLLLLLVAWIHGCVGIHFWLRLKPWYPQTIPMFLALAVLLPVLAMAGALEAVRQVAELARRPEWVTETLAASHFTDAGMMTVLHRITQITRLSLGAILILVLLAGAWRNRYERRHQSIRVTYPGGRVVTAPLGFTLLEISRSRGVPHASVCGGRGRCSTCRVRVLHGLEDLPTASIGELAVLSRVKATRDVRLACQLRPTADLMVMPLVPPGISTRDSFGAADYLQGDEREICVLFADLRGFTRITERKLPYDTVFFLNRYFETMGEAIETAGGVPNQFTGDGVMALFGIERGTDQGCRDALRAAAAMIEGLATMSTDLTSELEEPLRMGIGIHCGPTVVGRMGRGVAMYLTAVGDTVHVASRLQDLTKEYHCPIIISDTVARHAGVNVDRFESHEITVRNRSEPIAIRTIDDPSALTSHEVLTR
ncbi:MAG TPA: adenylate/guanylate cyclase domain-containing protein [Magnetospirillaceae bacterium]|jgi:adenylate cyclase